MNTDILLNILALIIIFLVGSDIISTYMYTLNHKNVTFYFIFDYNFG